MSYYTVSAFASAASNAAAILVTVAMLLGLVGMVGNAAVGIAIPVCMGFMLAALLVFGCALLCQVAHGLANRWLSRH